MLIADDLSYLNGKTPLIEGIDLTFQPGHLYGILGPNGSGKTTFFRCLMGLWKPSRGKVWWKGKDLLLKERRAISQIISLVPQQPHATFDFTVEEMVQMGRFPHGDVGATAQIEETLRRADVWHLRKALIHEISSGERQRVYIARALITEAPAILLDEPTTNLDILHQVEIWALLKDLAADGKTVVVASHDFPAARKHCDQLAVFEKGHCVLKGTQETVFQGSRWNEIFGVQTMGN